jgi:hypothetical protein
MREVQKLESRVMRPVRKSYPFLIVFGLEAVFILYLVIGHRGLIGHDAFQYFGLQYYFLNNAVNAGETAQWMPLMTHGTVSNWWYAVQSSMVQAAFLALGPLNRVLSGWNFLPIYYLGILFDLTVMLLGVWLLGRRYFTSNLTSLFVCISALGSTIWFTQPWYNLHLYYALPLILHFVHELLEKGQWRYFFLAGNLFAIQCCGNLPYFLPMTSLIISLYTLLYILFFGSVARAQVVLLLKNWRRAIVPISLVAVSLYAVILVLTSGTDLIANYNVGRLPDGTVTLDDFLTYGTNSNLRWFEFLSRVSAVFDYNLYFGYLALTFAALALLVTRTKHLLVIAGTTLVVLLIANSTPVAAIFYYVWPTMRYFRHLSLTSTIVRLLLCLMAGFGFEQILLAPAKEHSVKLRLAVFGLLQFAVMLFIFSLSYPRAVNWIAAAVLGTFRLDSAVFEESYLLPYLVKSAVWCLLAGAFFAAVLSRRFSARALAITAIAFQTADVYSFKLELSRLRTMPLTASQYEVSELQQMPYSAKRLPIDYDTHPRAKEVPQNRYRGGVEYWTTDSYLFIDPPANRGRADHWLWFFDDFLRAFAREELRDIQHRPQAFRVRDSFLFPTDNPFALSAGGISEDKIQFFSQAHHVPSDPEVARLLASGVSDGNVLLVSGTADEQRVTSGLNERLRLAYEVTRYDSNNIRIRVSGVAPGTWLYYADAWHPSWQATVNGKNVAVSKANLAYKAVPLNEGENVVHFRFHSTPLWISQSFLNWNALLWVLFVPCLAITTMRTNPEGDNVTIRSYV